MDFIEIADCFLDADEAILNARPHHVEKRIVDFLEISAVVLVVISVPVVVRTIDEIHKFICEVLLIPRMLYELTEDVYVPLEDVLTLRSIDVECSNLRLQQSFRRVLP